MTRYLSLFLIIAICFSSCSKTPDEVVKSVNEKYQKINSKLKDYDTRTVDNIVSPGAPGTITGYYRERVEEMKKITAANFTDTNRVFIDYYFDDGMMLYVYCQDFIYNRSNKYTEEKARANGDSVWYDDKKTRLEISRYYFDTKVKLPTDLRHFTFTKNIMVKWIGPDGAEVKAGSDAFTTEESVLWAQAAILMKQLKETPQ